MPRKGDVVLPERTYRTMRALMKAMAIRIGTLDDDLEFTGKEMRDADKLTLEQSFEGEEADWEDATWTLTLVEQPPPPKPTVVRREPVEPEPTLESERAKKSRASAPAKDPDAVALGRKGGKKGGPARAGKLTSEQRSASARKAAKARWSDRPKDDGASDTTAAEKPSDPDWRVAPGETLKEIMAERGISEMTLSRMTGYRLPVGAVRALLDGTAKLTAKVARELEVALGKPSADFWVGLEAQYRKPVTKKPTKTKGAA